MQIHPQLKDVFIPPTIKKVYSLEPAKCFEYNESAVGKWVPVYCIPSGPIVLTGNLDAQKALFKSKYCIQLNGVWFYQEPTPEIVEKGPFSGLFTGCFTGLIPTAKKSPDTLKIRTFGTEQPYLNLTTEYIGAFQTMSTVNTNEAYCLVNKTPAPVDDSPPQNVDIKQSNRIREITYIQEQEALEISDKISPGYKLEISDSIKMRGRNMRFKHVKFSPEAQVSKRLNFSNRRK